jgi:hypothetical protein
MVELWSWLCFFSLLYSRKNGHFCRTPYHTIGGRVTHRGPLSHPPPLALLRTPHLHLTDPSNRPWLRRRPIAPSCHCPLPVPCQPTPKPSTTDDVIRIPLSPLPPTNLDSNLPHSLTAPIKSLPAKATAPPPSPHTTCPTLPSTTAIGLLTLGLICALKP